MRLFGEASHEQIGEVVGGACGNGGGSCDGAALVLCAASSVVGQDGVRPAARVTVVFSGGHTTDERDNGRPVVLIAGALGVPSEVFRAAFRRVRPAPPGTQPTPEQARRNKRALLEVLAPYGVTNERLDQVSNYYRYRREQGEMWPTRPATAYAEVERGVILKIVVTDGGSGYSSPPLASIPSAAKAALGATLAFSTKLETNGSVASVTPADAQKR